MNRTKIEWVNEGAKNGRGYTWNTLTGCLGPRNDGNTCPYCFAKRIADGRFKGTPAFPNGFEITWHEDRLNDPLRVPAGSSVFVGSMTDMAAPWAAKYLPRVLEIVRARQDVTFMFLTKQPVGFTAITWPSNCWVGMTYTGQGSGKDPSYISLKWRTEARIRFISMEPLLGGVMPNFRPAMGIPWLNWIILGAQTGPGAVAPSPEWIANIDRITRCCGIPLFMKDNLRPYWPGEWRREFPA